MKISRRMASFAFLALLLALFPHPLWGAMSTLTNAPPEQRFEPGQVLIVPDGRRAAIERVLPNGDLATSLGIVISPEGLIRDGEYKGRTVVLEPETGQGANPDEVRIEAGQGTIVAPEKGAIAAGPESNAGEEKIVPEAEAQGKESHILVPGAVKEPKAQDAAKAETPESHVALPDAAGAKPPREDQAAAPRQLTLVELLPMTRTGPEKSSEPLPPEKPVKKPDEAVVKAKAEKAGKKTQKPEPKKAPPKAVKHEKPLPEKAPPKAEKPVKKPAKPKMGEELRIPPEAAKKGDLSFLEGCWQGIRPEYYSKRTIRECFCFGANGSRGKRRVFDPQGHRMCIGASRAKLSPDGTLAVTSQGAACDDGERWGSAEMICKNSGPSTPCSWVFRDANNGRQAYRIPFTRVESCGR